MKESIRFPGAAEDPPFRAILLVLAMWGTAPAQGARFTWPSVDGTQVGP